jgi:hypothetical protein
MSITREFFDKWRQVEYIQYYSLPFVVFLNTKYREDLFFMFFYTVH